MARQRLGALIVRRIMVRPVREAREDGLPTVAPVARSLLLINFRIFSDIAAGIEPAGWWRRSNDPGRKLRRERVREA